MIRIVKKDINFDFVGRYKTLGTISAIVVLVSVVLVAVKGLNFGIDFKGGTNIVYDFENRPSVDVVRDILASDKIVGSANFVGKSEISVQISKQISLIKEKDVRKLASLLKTKYSKKIKKIRPYIDGSNKLHIVCNGAIDTQQLKRDLAKRFPIESITSFGVDETTNKLNTHQYDINFIQLSNDLLKKIQKKSKGKVTISSLEQVGPKVGSKLKQDGTLAVIYALFAILVYIAFRFDSRFSPGAVVALVHDVFITLGVFAVVGIEFNLPVIAALLTIVGYSLNDTIVIFDKVREIVENARSARKKGKLELGKLVNAALNATLSRTLLTSITTLGVVVAMLLLGGPTLLPFSIALLIGVVVGTYSSLFIATPVYLFLEMRNEVRMEQLEKREA